MHNADNLELLVSSSSLDILAQQLLKTASQPPYPLPDEKFFLRITL